MERSWLVRVFVDSWFCAKPFSSARQEAVGGRRRASHEGNEGEAGNAGSMGVAGPSNGLVWGPSPQLGLCNDSLVSLSSWPFAASHVEDGPRKVFVKYVIEPCFRTWMSRAL